MQKLRDIGSRIFIGSTAHLSLVNNENKTPLSALFEKNDLSSKDMAVVCKLVAAGVKPRTVNEFEILQKLKRRGHLDPQSPKVFRLPFEGSFINGFGPVPAHQKMLSRMAVVGVCVLGAGYAVCKYGPTVHSWFAGR